MLYIGQEKIHATFDPQLYMKVLALTPVCEGSMFCEEA